MKRPGYIDLYFPPDAHRSAAEFDKTFRDGIAWAESFGAKRPLALWRQLEDEGLRPTFTGPFVSGAWAGAQRGSLPLVILVDGDAGVSRDGLEAHRAVDPLEVLAITHRRVCDEWATTSAAVELVRCWQVMLNPKTEKKRFEAALGFHGIAENVFDLDMSEVFRLAKAVDRQQAIHVARHVEDARAGRPTGL